MKLSTILKDHSSKFTSAASIVQKVRAKKTETEIQLITEAAELTETIDREITDILRPGMSEIEIQKLFHKKRMNTMLLKPGSVIHVQQLMPIPTRKWGMSNLQPEN